MTEFCVLVLKICWLNPLQAPKSISTSDLQERGDICIFSLTLESGGKEGQYWSCSLVVLCDTRGRCSAGVSSPETGSQSVWPSIVSCLSTSSQTCSEAGKCCLAPFSNGRQNVWLVRDHRGTVERTNKLSPGPLSRNPVLLNNTPVKLTLCHLLLYFMSGHVLSPSPVRPLTDVFLLQCFWSRETGACVYLSIIQSMNAVPALGQEPDVVNEAIESFGFVLSWIFALLLETSSVGP